MQEEVVMHVSPKTAAAAESYSVDDYAGLAGILDALRDEVRAGR